MIFARLVDPSFDLRYLRFCFCFSVEVIRKYRLARLTQASRYHVSLNSRVATSSETQGKIVFFFFFTAEEETGGKLGFRLFPRPHHMPWVSEGGVASVPFPSGFLHLTFSTPGLAGADMLPLFASIVF